MEIVQYDLVDPPESPRARELWIQHAAGFILFRDVRQYAMERIDPALPETTRAAVQKGIDDAVYGLMMVIDGIPGSLSNEQYSVAIDFIVRLARQDGSDDPNMLSELDLRDNGDGMCAGYHGWLEGDFGKYPVAARRIKK